MKPLFSRVLSVHGTELPPNLLLIAKLLVLGLTLKQYHHELPDVFAPIVPIFEGLPAPYFRLTLQTAFVVAGAALFLNYRVRTACLVLGAVFVMSTMADRTGYHNSLVFVGLVFTMIGLQDRNREPRLLRWQLGMVYVGCGINKFLEADWRSGQYFDYFLSQIHQSNFYFAIDPFLPDGRLGLILCWTVIVQELSTGVLFFIPRLQRMAVWIGAGIHAGAAMMVGADYGIFLSAILSSYLVVLSWPDDLLVRNGSRLAAPLVWLHRLSHGTDPTVKYEHTGIDGLTIEANGRAYHGWPAFWRLAIWTPMLYLMVMGVMTSVWWPWLPRVVRLVGFGAAVLLAVAAFFWIRKRWMAMRLPAPNLQPSR